MSTQGYQDRYHTYLQRAAIGLEALVADHLRGARHIDRVSSRAKDPGRFAEKAARRNADGTPKYRDPLHEIQDQLGVRVVVLYLATVDEIWTTLTPYFQAIEEKDLVPESHWEFGYFGRHAVMALPSDVVPKGVDLDEAPRFFELQVKTLFQHAWSEANHDLGYKPPSPLSGDQERRMAYAAAQAWGADRAFEELRTELTRA